MESVPVWSATVAVIDSVDGSMVAMTSPGTLKPVMTARTWLPFGEGPMDCTTPVPFPVCIVEMVVTTAWVLRLTTVIPPPLPALAT
jgi:hypothetical protein